MRNKQKQYVFIINKQRDIYIVSKIILSFNKFAFIVVI